MRLRWALAALAALFFSSPAWSQEAVGDWRGNLVLGAVELRVGISITTGEGGALTGALVSPDQSPRPVPLDGVKLEAGKLFFAVPAIRGAYEGAWDGGRQAWVGTWSQGGQSLPLVLTKGAVQPAARPQLPKPPYPYAQEEVAFDSVPGVRLAGTLTLPKGKGPFPAAILITGSGPQDRDETLMGHKPFLVLADHLTRHGIAVLRYDDRGVGKSTGQFPRAASTDFALDADAAAIYLRGRPEIDARKIGFIGHSEGGLVGPLAAVKDPKIAFVVMMAGPGVPGLELITAQRAAINTAAGMTSAVQARNQLAAQEMDRAVLDAKDMDQARQEATRILTGVGMSPAAAIAQAVQVATPWYRYFLAYDPRPTLKELRVPVLAINGDKDLQVIASQNLPAIREALKDNRDAEVVELPGLNHLFQTARTGLPSEYGKIEETMSPAALDLITDWIGKRTRR